MKYEIVKDYIQISHVKPRRRSGIPMPYVVFLVAHDTGNINSTAKQNVDYFKRTYNTDTPSAHIFVDDKEIIECIPAFSNPEKAWHVLYNKPLDNELYGDDANDIAIGVELCYGDNIDPYLAYEKYVWVLAYLCKIFDLESTTDIIGHMILDPERKTDPINALKRINKSFENLINDVRKEFDWLNDENHWAIKNYESLNNRGLTIYEKRFEAPLKRGEAFSLVSGLLDLIDDRDYVQTEEIVRALVQKLFKNREE